MSNDLLSRLSRSWSQPEIPEQIPQGDMPGDQVRIGPEHIAKSGVIFPRLLELLAETVKQTGRDKVVVAVCGGSGVGKSETASLLSFYLRQMGIGSYTMSGDNYPRRIPMYNDAERLRVFRCAGLRGLVGSGLASPERMERLRALQLQELDADPAQASELPWLEVYQREGRSGLAGYLGTGYEQDFDEVSQILDQFHNGAGQIWLKRMGRTETEVWYEAVDFSEIQVLVLEWTHGNNRNIRGVDIPILLNSTPEETRAHRRQRNRDGKTDAPFTTMVLEIEQQLLDSQADRAKLIVSKQGQLLSYGQYRRAMAQ